MVEFLGTELNKYITAALGWSHIFFSGIPILTFHDIEDIPEIYSISTERFIELLKYLKFEGYKTITAKNLLNINIQDVIKKKIILLTFDDGLASHIDIAAEYLYKFGFSATFFLISSFIKGERKSYNLGNRKYIFMSFGDINNLVKGGFEIGSHSHTHRLLGTLTQKEIVYEIGQSARVLEDITGIPIISFAYPYGRYGAYNNYVKKTLRENHIKLAFTQMGYRANLLGDPLLVPRINVDQSDNLNDLINKIKGCYDFIGRARSCYYKFKDRITGNKEITL